MNQFENQQEHQHHQDYIEIEGVHFFGQDAGPVQENDLRQIEVPAKSILHIVRHLRSLDPNIETAMVGGGPQGQDLVTHEHIQSQLQTVGSKFHPKLTDPQKLADFGIAKARQIIQTNQAEWLSEGDFEEMKVHVVVDQEDKTALGLLQEDCLGTSPVIELLLNCGHWSANRVVEKVDETELS